MGKEKPRISQTPLSEITKEHAESFGRQAGMFLAAGLFSMKTAGNVHESLVAVKDSEFRKDFEAHLWLVLDAALQPGAVGMNARAAYAKELGELSVALQQQAFELAMSHVNGETKGGPGVVEVLDGFLRTSDHCREVANALFENIRANLDNFVADGKKITVFTELARKAKEQMEDKTHDEKCENPDCPCHTNH